jgi:hypothetical protein
MDGVTAKKPAVAVSQGNLAGFEYHSCEEVPTKRDAILNTGDAELSTTKQAIPCAWL